MEPAGPLECVALLLVRDHHVLAEKRKLTKRLAPGALAIPGGHVEAGERVEQALMREAREELGIVPHAAAFVCTLMHLAEELRTLHYYAVRSWEGDVDRTAVNEYLRLTREGGLAWRTSM